MVLKKAAILQVTFTKSYDGSKIASLDFAKFSMFKCTLISGHLELRDFPDYDSTSAAMASIKGDQKVSLLFLEPGKTYTGINKPYFIAGPSKVGQIRTNEVFVPRSTVVTDLRGKEKLFNLTEHSFEYLVNPLKQHCLDKNSITAYIKETESLLARHLNATTVVAYSHEVSRATLDLLDESSESNLALRSDSNVNRQLRAQTTLSRVPNERFLLHTVVCIATLT